MVKVKGCDYAMADEKFDRKLAKKEMKSMKTAGIANEFKESKKTMKKPGVKGQKKNAKPVMGQNKGY